MEVLLKYSLFGDMIQCRLVRSLDFFITVHKSCSWDSVGRMKGKLIGDGFTNK
jgi:hypothetical protein